MNDFTPNQTQIPNALLDAMASYSNAEFRVAVAAWHHRNSWAHDGILPPTVSFLARATGLNEPQVRDAINSLSSRHVLPKYLLVHQLPFVDEARRTSIDAITRKRIFHRDKVCRWCGSDLDLTIDHIKPVVLGGTNEIENLQVLCRGCNSRKGADYQIVEEMFIE